MFNLVDTAVTLTSLKNIVSKIGLCEELVINERKMSINCAIQLTIL